MFTSKYYILKFIDAIGGGITGRKRLQKLAYIMKNNGFPIPQDFIYYRYGPYSQELSATVSELATFGLLDETSTSSGYKYKITQDGKDFLNLLETNNLVEEYKMDEKNNKLATSLKEQDPSLLELESTILFLQDYGESFEGACTKALELKPHLKDYFKKAKEIIAKIK